MPPQPLQRRSACSAFTVARLALRSAGSAAFYMLARPHLVAKPANQASRAVPVAFAPWHSPALLASPLPMFIRPARAEASQVTFVSSAGCAYLTAASAGTLPRQGRREAKIAASSSCSHILPAMVRPLSHPTALLAQSLQARTLEATLLSLNLSLASSASKDGGCRRDEG